MEDDGARLLTYGKAMCLIEQSHSNTAQCEYIGSSIEQSWFSDVVLRSKLCEEEISEQLVLGPCKVHARRTLNSRNIFSITRTTRLSYK